MESHTQCGRSSWCGSEEQREKKKYTKYTVEQSPLILLNEWKRKWGINQWQVGWKKIHWLILLISWGTHSHQRVAIRKSVQFVCLWDERKIREVWTDCDQISGQSLNGNSRRWFRVMCVIRTQWEGGKEIQFGDATTGESHFLRVTSFFIIPSQLVLWKERNSFIFCLTGWRWGCTLKLFPKKIRSKRKIHVKRSSYSPDVFPAFCSSKQLQTCIQSARILANIHTYIHIHTYARTPRR